VLGEMKQDEQKQDLDDSAKAKARTCDL